MTDQPKLFVLVDDKRECAEEGTVIIRDPRVALTLLTLLRMQIHTLAMDNDMGHGWEFEGRNILKRFFDTICKPTTIYPVHVVLVTNNEPAAKSMRDLLREHGYKQQSPTEFVRP